MNFLFANFKNSIDFFIRSHLAFSRKNYREKNEPKEGLFNSEEKILKESTLLSKYDLKQLKNNSTKQNYIENLYVLEILDSYLKIDFKENCKVLDIGSKNWSYAKAEQAFFSKHTNSLEIKGIEIDPNRLYSNLYSRNEVAKFHIKPLPEAEYLGGDLKNHHLKYNYITWFLPFIKKYPHVRWGLPLKHFKPEENLRHAYNLLKEGGKLFITNQGEEERDIQRELCEKLNITFDDLGKIESSFNPYKIERYGIIISK